MSTTMEWVKARRSSNGGQCVEVRRHGGAVEVRDSKDRSGPVLRFTGAEWEAFLDGARNREFDHLTAD
jgi:Domain of unknown function (DUF397)